MPRRSAPNKTLAKRAAGEFRFKIDAYSPETMPMARLVDYLRELATILGEPKDVHLLAIEPGSTVPVLQVEYESIPKVKARADAVRRGDAPRDPTDAYRKVNEMLRQDNARAVFQRGKRGQRVLEFPGKDEVQEEFANVKQFGSIEGVVIRVGGPGEVIPIILEAERERLAGCHTNRGLAKELAKYLFEPVRVVGMGYWARDAEGQWGLRHFRIETFERLESAPLSDAITKLRGIKVDWDDAAYEELDIVRHGRTGNGGA